MYERLAKINTVAIIGLGALGILYGQHFAKRLPRENLRIIADDKRIERYKKDKIYANGEVCDFNFVSPEEKLPPADLILVTVKYSGLSDAISSIKNQVGKDTLIVSALNGISSEGILAEAYGMERIIYSVAQGMDATRLDNRLAYSNMGILCIGDINGSSDKVRALAEFFDETSFPYAVAEDMKHRLWGKFMLNVGVNQTAAVYRCNYEGLQREGKIRETVIAAMREVILLSNKEGVSLAESDIDYWMEILDGLSPDGKPSMQQDIEAGRPSEVELFSGTVIGLGKKYNIKTPVNEWLYREIKDVESTFSSS